MFHQLVREYDFSRISTTVGTDNPEGSFVIRFRAVPARLEHGGILLKSGEEFVLDLTDKARDTEENRHFNSRLQNYFSLTAPDGSCWVLEASLRMAPDPVPWRVGFPIALFGNLEAEHEIAIMFDGVYFAIFADGVLMDRDAPFEEFDISCGWLGALCVCSGGIVGLAACHDVSGVTFREAFRDAEVSAQFYTPRGFNTWIGDVVTYACNGTFHIFYLLDRRHHGSRRSRGAHVFCHIATQNFRDWTDYGPVFELESSWQSVGTGNAFEFDGKLCLSFGWHTERTRPYERRANFLFERNIRELGHTGEIRYDELGDITPGGGSYAYSEDGVHFKKADILMHTLENPSIFVQPNGKLHLIQDGVWESDHPGCWKLIDSHFPPHDENSFARNCLDCPSFFCLDGWEYFYVGFSGFWGRPVGADSWIDFVEKGWDIYDGACVPMTAACNGRLIEGSWPRPIGWGSCLILREVVPLGGGRIGKKWLEEAMPKPATTIQLAPGRQDLPADGDVLVTAVLGPAVTSIVFDGDGTPFELNVNVPDSRASIGGAPGERLKTFRECLLEHPEVKNTKDLWTTPGMNAPFFGRAFAHEELMGLKAGGSLKVFIRRDRKLNCTMLDVDLCNCHTMVFGTAKLAIRHIAFGN